MVRPLSPGLKIGHYRILNLIGSGGLGAVYSAYDETLRRDVAIKTLHKTDGSIEALLKEARAAACLSHQNIVTVFEVLEDGAQAFLVTELLNGRNMREVLAGGVMSVTTVLDLTSQVAQGLAIAHKRGIVHRDVKPENLFLTSEGRVKILDFGLSRPAPQDATDDSTLLPSRVSIDGPARVVGTVGYMSPEQLRGEPTDPRTDIFALGVVLCELLTGRTPFAGASWAETVANTLSAEPRLAGLTSPLLEIVERCLRKAPSQRFANTDDVILALRLIRTSARRDVPRSEQAIVVYPFSGDEELHAVSAVTEAVTVGIRRLGLPTAGEESAGDCLRLQIPLSAPATAVGAEYVLEGRVSAARHSQIRVDARATRAVNGEVVGQWSHVMPQDQLPQFATCDLPGEIGSALLKGRSWSITEGNKTSRLASETFRLYSRGLQYSNLNTLAGFERSADSFRQATVLDPSYAKAHAQLSIALTSMMTGLGSPSPSLYVRARESAMRALALDDNLPEAHVAMGRVSLYFDWNLVGAKVSLQRALTLDPRCTAAYSPTAVCLLGLDEPAQAVELAARAVAIDPIHIPVRIRYGAMLYGARRYQKAIDEFTEILEFAPEHPMALTWLGCVQDAANEPQSIATLERAADVTGGFVTLAFLARAYGRAGRIADAKKLLRSIVRSRQRQFVSAINVAYVYAGLKRPDRALRWIRQAIDERCPEIVTINADPAFDDIRLLPQFGQMIQTAGLRRG